MRAALASASPFAKTAMTALPIWRSALLYNSRSMHGPMFVFLCRGSLVISKRQDIGSVVFFLTNLYIFVSSFMFHASVTEVWTALDFGAVYACMLAIFCQALHATFEFPWAKMAVAVLMGSLFYSLVLVYSSKLPTGFVFFVDVSAFVLNFLAAAVLAIVLVTVRIRKIRNHNSRHDASQQMPLKQRRRDSLLAAMWLLGPLIFFVVGYTCFSLDTIIGIWCNPEDVVQGHSLWHILAAVAYYLAWEGLCRYHRREEPYQFPEAEDLAPDLRREGEKDAPPEVETDLEEILEETSAVGSATVEEDEAHEQESATTAGK